MLQGAVVVGGEAEPVKLVVHYPYHYPWTRFEVAAPELDLPRHQHPFGKNLCVFPRGSEHWRRDWLAGDVIAARVPELIRAVREGGETLLAVEEPQGEPYTDYYDFRPLGGILVPAEILHAASGIDGGECTVRLADSVEWLGLLSGASISDLDLPPIGTGAVTVLRRDNQTLATAPDELVAGLAGPSLSCVWKRLAAPPVAKDAAEFLDAFVAQGGRTPHTMSWHGRGPAIALVGLVFPEEVRQGEYADAWVFVVLGKRAKGRPPKPKAGEEERPGHRISAGLVRGMRCGVADLLERIPELAALRDKRVLVAGLGSLGAPLAKELARNLVQELRIIDHDFVDAGTVVRWETGLRAAGVSKALFLALEFQLNYPYTRVVPSGAVIGAAAQGTSDDDLDVLTEFLADVDLVIDATAEDNVTAALADCAQMVGVPMLAIWSIEGVGGVVGRIVPGETGCFHCLELHLSPDHGGSIPVPAPPTDQRRVQARGCADPTFTASAVDLLPLVHHGARLAFGELCRGTRDGYPRYERDVHVLSLRRPDGALFEPPEWGSFELSVHPDCPCHDD